MDIHNNSFNKKVFISALFLFTIQVIRICIRNFIFLFFENSIIVGTLSNTVFFILLLFFLVLFIRKSNIPVPIYRSNIKILFFVSAVVSAVIFFITPFITNNISNKYLITLFFSALVTPLFEEILFRGVIWNYLDADENKFSWLINALLFGLWHVGYVDSIILRTSIHTPGADIPKILFYKVLTGIFLGLIFALLRKKTKSVAIPLLLHILINTVGN